MTIITVSQLNRYIASRLKEDELLHPLYIKGEITDFKIHYASGHLYFSVKDMDARIKAVMFSAAASKLRFEPENGMNAIFTADLRMYEKTGDVQLYVTDIVPDGIGAMYLAAEQLKKRLAEEGLFDMEHKKAIPEIPRVIGAVTALNGAALQDIINVLQRRAPYIRLKVFNIPVQGSNDGEICRMLRIADEAGCDVIICGRGGGSAEDLMIWNSESIARTVYDMKTPVISAVGHEIDNTVIDLVSDLRAPTPSAAAELAAADIMEIYDAAAAMKVQLAQVMEKYLSDREQQCKSYQNKLELLYPKAKLSSLYTQAEGLRTALKSAMDHYLKTKYTELVRRTEQLETLSPLKVMSRGYSLVYRDNALIRSADTLKNGDRVHIVFSEGETDAVITR